MLILQGLAGVVKFQPGVPVKPMLAKPMTGISEVLPISLTLTTSSPYSRLWGGCILPAAMIMPNQLLQCPAWNQAACPLAQVLDTWQSSHHIPSNVAMQRYDILID